MDGEGVMLIQAQAAEAAAVKIIDRDDRQVIFSTRVSDGESRILVHALPPRPRVFAAQNLAGFIRFCEEARGGRFAAVAEELAIFLSFDGSYGRGSVTLMLEDERRENLVTLPLAIPPATRWLVNATLHDGQALKQREFIRLLRTLFHQRVDLSLLNAVRRITFGNNASGTSSIGHGRESMGRSIEAELTGATDLPEEFTVRAQAFQLLDGLPVANIRCCLEVNMADQTFLVIPDVDGIEVMFEQAVEWIARQLAEAVPEIPRLHGSF